MNKSKTPNPNHNQPKLKQINVRVSEAELLLLQQYSTECKLSISEYLRRCSLKRNLPRPPTCSHSSKTTLSILVSKLVEELSALSAIARSTNHPDISERAVTIAQLLSEIYKVSL
ncbi:hypothetical protein PCC9214_05504 (plasmid) [Planktothrix tepida]|uniref:Mobilization protein n=1 Tax=Planktothrix tepida PCC 9214 TaxID=671072 RepID=A0A1J1LFC0_9CYAN|nr:hypothetical protein [Planktothrix tepida]CAD5989075.1 hypothetical protein PCC9214_05504 [Planktothrix tepida]CUR30249.1 hypothetical protein PL921410001 [Planktothrix tepida PCC 9214]